MKLSKLSKGLLEYFASNLNLKVDKKSGILYGQKQGYNLLIRFPDLEYNAIITFNVSLDGEQPDEQTLTQYVNSNPDIDGCHIGEFRLSFVMEKGRSKKKSLEKLNSMLTSITNYLQVNNYENCCESCGEKVEIDPYIVGGIECNLCPTCYNEMMYQEKAKLNEEKENIVAGIVGALVGSVFGVIAIIVIGQLGYVASLSGVILAVCAIKGYELLGGKISNKGIILTSIVIIAMTYLGHRLETAIEFSQATGIPMLDFFKMINYSFFKEFPDECRTYYGNLAMLYLFVLFGAVPTIFNAIRSSKVDKMSYRIEQ